MQGVFPLVCLCLVISVAVQEIVGEGSGKCVSATVVQQLFEIKDKLHSLEDSLQTTSTELESTKAQLNDTKTELEFQLNATKIELESAKSQLSATKTEVEFTKSQLSAVKQGSSFIRWGRKSCPGGTTLVYSGIAGGKHFYEKGSGTNPLCLTRKPQYDNTNATMWAYGHLYGAEYDNIPSHHDHDVPCSVCLAPQSSTIMVPATLTCPPGWTPQYTGHLVSQYHNCFATEYVCLDGSPEHDDDDSSEVTNDDGILFHYVLTMCGILPCPPYNDYQVVTCVVCSK